MIDLIINPSGASGRTLRIFNRKIKPVFDRNHVQYKLHYSSLEKDIDFIVKEITEDGMPHTIVIVGGDGSMNLAVNGLCNPELNKIGYIPAGSGNDLGKALGIEKNYEHLISRIIQGDVIRKLDICEVEVKNLNGKTDTIRRRFNISSGFGFDAEICACAASGEKSILNRIGLGKLIYILTALRVIFRTKMLPAKISIDQKETDCSKMIFTVVMNTCYEGGGFKFCPDAAGDDGLMDVCYGENISKFDFFRIFPYAYSGNHVKFDGVHCTEAKTIEVHSDMPLWIHTDGEVVGQSCDVSYRLTGEKIQLIC